MTRFLCADAARERGEPTVGTASRIDRWLLIEVSGAWGPRALPQARSINDELLLLVQQRAKTAHARTLLIRRYGWSAPAGPRRVFAADSRPSHEMLVSRYVTDSELRTLNLPFDGQTEGWQAEPSLIAVCTHGRHDACCAVRGRSVAAALSRSHPELTWETSHLGGDRFAANVLVLPSGHYLGQVPADDAGRLVDDLLAGLRPDPCYRGRSCWAPPVQAALSMAGMELGERHLDALRPTRLDQTGTRSWRVHIQRANAEDVVAEIEQQQGPDLSLLTCRAETEHLVPHWNLIRLA